MKSGYGRKSTSKTSHAPGMAGGNDKISDAVAELHRQHPHDYTEQGPFYSHEILHKPAVKPSGSY